MSSFLIKRININQQIYSTAESRMEPTPAGFIGIYLLPSQRTSLAALVDIEEKRVIMCDDRYYRTSCAVLSEPFGSGKTMIILAMILRGKIPAVAYSQVMPPSSFELYATVTRRIKDSKNFIASNLIIVASSCLDQWVDAIQTFTALKVFSIGHYNDMIKFITMFQAGHINKYDIILLKNGTITGKLGFADDATVNNRNMVNVMMTLTANHMWARVIFDDFDTVNVQGDKMFNSVFQLFVSTTEYSRYSDRSKCMKNTILKSKPIMKLFNVRSEANFIEESIKLTIVNCFVCKFDNPNDKMIGLIGQFGENEMNDIVEMMNGGAVNTVAERLGITIKSPSEVFRRVLGNQYEKYVKSRLLLEHINNTAKKYDTLSEWPYDVKFTDAVVSNLENKLKLRKATNLEYKHPRIAAVIDAARKDAEADYHRLNVGIQRVFDNIRSGQCAVCLSDFESTDTCWCLRCCGVLFCELCVKDANQLGSRHDVITNTKQVMGSCANCKARIYMNDFICIPADFKIEDIIKSITAEEAHDEEPDNVVSNPKLQALLDIIAGKMPANMEKFDNPIKNLMQGRKDIPYTGKNRKVLVFASFNETLEIVENLLKTMDISFSSLKGTHGEISTTVQKFQESGNVLLINSRTHCAGLNLQFATDIVYMHKITDANIEAQVAGRGQRIGRQCNLNIWYILFGNEKETLTRQYAV